jgi:outer membrane protein W
MTKRLWRMLLSACMILAISCPAAAGQWRIPLGVAYVSGATEVFDQLEDNVRAEYSDVESAEGLPVGLTVQPYYEFDSGLGIGFGFGPFTYVFGDVDYFSVPANVCLRFAFVPKASVTPYIRAGVSTQLVNGDYVEDHNIGAIGALGVEFMRDRGVSLAIEVGYDNSSIEFKDLTTADPDDTEEIEPVGFMLSIMAVF